MRINRLLPFVLAALFVALPAAAHHGWSSYDADQAMRFDAELIEVRYRNPHAEVVVEHEGNRWDVVLAPTTRMETRGLPQDGLAVGRTITIEAYPRLDGTRELRAERIVVDGTTVELR
ncbi:hypothetical protein E2F46_07515 [Luteimonas aestuarii]|uniref:Uncharacterized protein n=1 Tax=Luteimonas aestuarii TaxID=453837 RepID=A0A4R5TVA1_9GAMM|nr:DUF6152 family protein [Luteimonas aestuarii]TDK25013.1 hypothetical protein E2F46_07515 [Luteimonas aestuarii]